MMFKREKKIIKTSNATPKGEWQCSFILLPLGYYYNSEFLKASRGDIIEFAEGEQYRILNVTKIELNGPIANLLCFARYGFYVDTLKDIWRQGVIYDGHRKRAISDTECLLIGYGTEDLSRNGKETTSK